LLAAGLAPSRLAVVPNGFEVSRLRLSRTREAMREKLGLRDACVIGFAGWFDVWDRLDFLLEVFEKLKPSHPTLKLCLVGAGPAMEAFDAKLAKSPFKADVVLTGAVARSEVYDYIQVFDIGILPHSNQFGSPIVMFEMMGLRIPLALPRLPPIEDVHGRGSTAQIFTPLDANECARALERLISDPTVRTELCTRSYEKLTTEHTWKDTATRILAVLTPQIGRQTP